MRHGTPHGIACSFCLPAVMRWALGADPTCDAALRRIFGADLERGVDQLGRFLEGIGVSTAPADYGVSGKEWDSLVDNAMQGERGRNFIGRRAAVHA